MWRSQPKAVSLWKWMGKKTRELEPLGATGGAGPGGCDALGPSQFTQFKPAAPLSDVLSFPRNSLVAVLFSFQTCFSQNWSRSYHFFFLLNAFTVQSTPLFWFFCWFFSHCFKLDQLAVQSFQLLWAPCVGRAVSSLHGFLYYPSLSVLTN